MKILVISEHDNSVLSSSTLNALSAAKLINSEIDVLVAGHSCKQVAEQASRIPIVQKIIHVDSPEYKNFIAENISKLIIDLSENYSHIVAPSSTMGKNYMPRVAAILDVMQISDIIKVIDDSTFQRPIYAGNALSTVKSSDKTKIITVRTTAFEATDDSGGNAEIIHHDYQSNINKTKYIKSELSGSERPELTSAGIVVSGGRGMQDGSNFTMLEGIADKLGAAVGASRAAVDAGFVPNDYQVGQTGKVVAPDLYIAVGISGAIQHLAGMKDSKIIVAINKDEDAPIFQVADYGLVADLFDAVPEINSKL